MEARNWKTLAFSNSRRRTVNKIAEVLRRHLPYAGADQLWELESIANKFERKIYYEATSESDYFRKISSKLLTMETKQQNHMASSSKIPQYPEMEARNWKTLAFSNSRKKTVDKIAAVLIGQIPDLRVAGIWDFRSKAIKVEEKIYTEATSESDYFRKLSSKLLTMETEQQNRMASSSKIPQYPGMEAHNWRTSAFSSSRKTNVDKTAEVLKGHLPYSGADGLCELTSGAIKVGEQIYNKATIESDYFGKTSSKLLTMETKQQNRMASSSEIPHYPEMESGDWRTLLQDFSRKRNVINKRYT